jgi:hypothetical protein
MVQAQSVQIESQEPWASNTYPTDVPGRHVEEVEAGRHVYTVVQRGSMDGENCRTPHGSWLPLAQSWESNRAVRLENVGETEVINPWLSSGKNDFRDIEEIVAGAIDPEMTDREKAIALYYLEMNHRFHAHTGDDEGKDPVKVFNLYGFTTCGHDSICLAGLWRSAGLQRRPARPVGHCITQVFYDSAWHILDADMQCLYLMRDNHTIVGEKEIVHDHDLVKRTHTEGLLLPDDRAKDEWEASLFVYEGDAEGSRDVGPTHTMDMRLRPGEALTWRWGQLRPVKYHGVDDIATMFGQKAADTICNGRWEYRPEFTGDIWRRGVDSVENVRVTPEGLAAEAGEIGTVVWTIRSPYVFVGGRIEVEGEARFSLSWDGDSWLEAGEDLDPFFPRKGTARYQYRLRCELSGEDRLKKLGVVNDLQMAMLALPGMMVGENGFVYTDESPDERQVRITHEWVERSIAAPPEAPSAPLFPIEGGETEGTEIVFKWVPPADPNGEKIADYHFELSEYADLRWPLSPNFRKLISNTADRDKAQYSLPYAGLLSPDREYYWRVRAKNERGVWGPWSRTWIFTPRAPGPPVDVTLDFDADRGIGTLCWKANPVGRPPARYRVYGSDEKGFSISDEPYDLLALHAGDWRDSELSTRFPANFATETAETELVVVGKDLELANANKAFYRVVAVDEQGNRSWSSEYAAVPRPFIHTRPVTAARVGEDYRYQAGTIRSLGDLSLRGVEGDQVAHFWDVRERCALEQGPAWFKQVVNFWDVQEPEYALEQGPAWLEIDAASGLLTGIPDAPGKTRIVVTATLRREMQELDPERLAWGHRVVTRVISEEMGPAIQEFFIDVGR